MIKGNQKASRTHLGVRSDGLTFFKDGYFAWNEVSRLDLLFRSIADHDALEGDTSFELRDNVSCLSEISEVVDTVA